MNSPHSSAAAVRINARLSGQDALHFRELQHLSGRSSSDLLRDALREYHATHVRAQRDPLALLAGYIGAGDGPEDLSSRYKAYLDEALDNKVSHDSDR
ncbi:MAG: hypothetical protein LBS89_00950 [Zoogloeaceae bacterium]|nr:hypothetical protein [Zoogloeaceae bacterium]